MSDSFDQITELQRRVSVLEHSTEQMRVDINELITAGNRLFGIAATKIEALEKHLAETNEFIGPLVEKIFPNAMKDIASVHALLRSDSDEKTKKS